MSSAGRVIAALICVYTKHRYAISNWCEEFNWKIVWCPELTAWVDVDGGDLLANDKVNEINILDHFRCCNEMGFINLVAFGVRNHLDMCHLCECLMSASCFPNATFPFLSCVSSVFTQFSARLRVQRLTRWCILQSYENCFFFLSLVRLTAIWTSSPISLHATEK